MTSDEHAARVKALRASAANLLTRAGFAEAGGQVELARALRSQARRIKAEAKTAERERRAALDLEAKQSQPKKKRRRRTPEERAARDAALADASDRAAVRRKYAMSNRLELAAARTEREREKIRNEQLRRNMEVAGRKPKSVADAYLYGRRVASVGQSIGRREHREAVDAKVAHIYASMPHRVLGRQIARSTRGAISRMRAAAYRAVGRRAPVTTDELRAQADTAVEEAKQLRSVARGQEEHARKLRAEKLRASPERRKAITAELAALRPTIKKHRALYNAALDRALNARAAVEARTGPGPFGRMKIRFAKRVKQWKKDHGLGKALKKHEKVTLLQKLFAKDRRGEAFVPADFGGLGQAALMSRHGVRVKAFTPVEPKGPPGTLHKGKQGGIFYYDKKGHRVYLKQGGIGGIFSTIRAFQAGRSGARLYH